MDGVSLTLYAEIARTVGLVCQHADYQLFGETIAEELAFAPANLGTPRDVIEQRVERAREGLGIEHLGLTASPLALSVGEKQRVSIASVLTMDTQVLALDEPTLGLDPAAKQRLAGLIDALCAHGKAVVIATHDAGFSAAVADRIVRLERGRIVHRGRSESAGMTDGEGQSDRRHAYRAVGYIPADTFLHRMDPRTKLLTVLAISIAAFATISPLRTAILFAFVVCLAVAAGLVRPFSRGLLLLLPLLVFIVVIDIFFPEISSGHVYLSAQVGPFSSVITSGGLLYAAAKGIRVLVIGGISFLFVMTTSYTDFVASLRISRLPPVIAFSLGYALKSMTALADDLRNIMDAQRSRALEFDRGTLIKNRRKLMALGVPMTVSILNRARYVTEAMQSRGFASTPRPTCYRPPRPGRHDLLLLVALGIVCLATLLIPV